MSDKTTILLHVGTHKTGSTSLQKTLDEHRDALRAAGITYLGTGGPYPNLYSAFLPDPMAFVWNVHSGLDEGAIRARDAETLSDLEQDLAQARGTTVVISSEYLSMLDEGPMTRLRDFLGRHGKLHAVYFYRELHSWISSDSQQLAKAGLRVRPTRYDTAIQRLYDLPLRLAGVFGREATTFVKFEDAVKTGICDALLSRFDLPTLASLGLSERHDNESVSADAVRALFLYNHLNPLGSPTRDEREVARLRKLPGGKYRTAGFWPQQIRDYAAKRKEVQRRLGLRLAPPETLPVSQGPDPMVEELLRMTNRHLWQTSRDKAGR
ncbi:hypothetical protein [Actibacterium sp. MT2.3-13A]|uniref:hypothetical protein n=1 Tax=Actibacterium sp. MT2.3-13A TaxID=2828332 RepID=UPI001BA8C377|nr:hypothetical protein [Actibacterium sp. MT2.3-13A]